MGKRQDFINLAKAGGSRQDFIDLAASHGVHDPAEALTIFDMLMSGALPSELKHGGIASLAPRKRYAQGIGPVGEGKSFPTNSKMPMMDPYKLFFMYQNKLMRDKKKEGLAEILGV
jgi:hypothetical protein